MSTIICGKRVEVMLKDVIPGKLDTEIQMLNYFITLLKLNIWTQKTEEMDRKRGKDLC